MVATEGWSRCFFPAPRFRPKCIIALSGLPQEASLLPAEVLQHTAKSRNLPVDTQSVAFLPRERRAGFCSPGGLVPGGRESMQREAAPES